MFQYAKFFVRWHVLHHQHEPTLFIEGKHLKKFQYNKFGFNRRTRLEPYYFLICTAYSTHTQSLFHIFRLKRCIFQQILLN